MPTSFIAIIGSADKNRTFDPPLQNPGQAVKAAEDLGQELALAGFGIVVYSSDPVFIEPHVVDGYLKSGCAKKGSIQVRHPISCPATGYDAANAVFDFQPDTDPAWEVSFYQSIRNTQGMLLIGGGYSTLIIGIAAIPDRKPLIPIACFGGGAQKIWSLVSPENHIVTAEEKKLLGQPWTGPIMASDIVASLSNQMRRHEEWEVARRASESLPEVVENGLRIAWLSDLHIAREDDDCPFTMRTMLGGLFRFKGSRFTEYFPEQNVRQILEKIVSIRPDHILVTGDCTNYAEDHQFADIVSLFRSAQQSIRKKAIAEDLDPVLWTVLPGNHDVTDENSAKGNERHNLGMFFKHFQSLFPSSGPNYDRMFPLEKKIPSKYPKGLRVRLSGLDSNVSGPVWHVGFNAHGRIDEMQMNRLNRVLSQGGDEISLVAMHHHPVLMPFISSDYHTYFMSMNDKDATDLIRICANNGVSAILHGHYHEYSFWSTLVPQNTHKMAIIGSPAGTRDLPGITEFLELREATRESVAGVRQGLALYRHVCRLDSWSDEYVAFIESRYVSDD